VCRFPARDFETAGEKTALYHHLVTISVFFCGVGMRSWVRNPVFGGYNGGITHPLAAGKERKPNSDSGMGSS